MKPGTLVTLNHRLCRPLQPDRSYVLRPPAPLLCARAVAPPDTRPVVPALGAAAPATPQNGLWRSLRKVMVRGTLLVLVVGVHLALVSFERVERSRERVLLGRAIAEREQHAQRLLEANRHIVGVIRVQHAMLQGQAAEPVNVLARVTTRQPARGPGG